MVAVALANAQAFGFDTVGCSSTGNLANAVAAQAARLGLKTYILVPADLEPAKILNTQVYGATLVRVDGNYDHVNRLCSQIADRYNWGFVNVNLRPYYAEGSKTVGFEIAEQLGWRLPDNIVCPMAGGSLITKIRKAFSELVALGLVEDKPVKLLRRAGHRLLAHLHRRQERHRTSLSRSAPTPSPAHWPSATLPTDLTPRAPFAPPAAGPRMSPTSKSSPPFRNSPRPKASSLRLPAASPLPSPRAFTPMAASSPTSSPSPASPATASKPLTACRTPMSQSQAIRPRLTDFENFVEERNAVNQALSLLGESYVR